MQHLDNSDLAVANNEPVTIIDTTDRQQARSVHRAASARVANTQRALARATAAAAAVVLELYDVELARSLDRSGPRILDGTLNPVGHITPLFSFS